MIWKGMVSDLDVSPLKKRWLWIRLQSVSCILYLFNKFLSCHFSTNSECLGLILKYEKNVKLLKDQFVMIAEFFY